VYVISYLSPSTPTRRNCRVSSRRRRRCVREFATTAYGFGDANAQRSRIWVTTADGCVHTDDTTKLSPTSCEFVYTPPTRRDSTVSYRRRRRCVLGFSDTLLEKGRHSNRLFVDGGAGHVDAVDWTSSISDQWSESATTGQSVLAAIATSERGDGLGWVERSTVGPSTETEAVIGRPILQFTLGPMTAMGDQLIRKQA